MCLPDYPEDVTYDLSVKLNDLDITRAVEQTALEMRLLLGRGIQGKVSSLNDLGGEHVRPRALLPRVKGSEKLAIISLLGSLKHRSYCKGRIVCSDSAVPGNAKVWEKYAKELGHWAARKGLRGEWDIDFVASACSGVRDLLLGHSGASISVLAGGPKGVFDAGVNLPHPESPEHERFFVMSIRPAPDDDDQVLLDGLVHKSRRKQTLFKSIKDCHLVDNMVKSLHKVERTETFTVGTMGSSANATPGQRKILLGPYLSQFARVRVFLGSSVAAGMSTYFPETGIDAFLSIVRRAEAILIATAARVTRGGFYAFPVVSADNIMVAPKTNVLRIDDFLCRNKDCFCVATGITPGSLLDGIRFQTDGSVFIQSLCMRAKTRTVRIIDQNIHDLSQRQFHHADAKAPLTYSMVIRQLSEAGL